MKLCPLCRQPLDGEDGSSGDRYVVVIRNGPRSGERIELVIPESCVKQIAELLAVRMEDDVVGSIYYRLRWDPSRLVLYQDDSMLQSNHILQRSHCGKLSVQVEIEGSNERIERLESTGYADLVEFFKSYAQMPTTTETAFPYELGLALKLCMSLLQPVATRGGSIIDEEIEQEIIEVLVDARNNSRSVYEALRYEFF